MTAIDCELALLDAHDVPPDRLIWTSYFFSHFPSDWTDRHWFRRALLANSFTDVGSDEEITGDGYWHHWSHVVRRADRTELREADENARVLAKAHGARYDEWRVIVDVDGLRSATQEDRARLQDDAAEVAATTARSAAVKVAALEIRLRVRPTRELPRVAADLVARGVRTPAVFELAALVGVPDVERAADVERLAPQALRLLADADAADEEVARLLVRHHAYAIVAGATAAAEGAAAIVRIIEHVSWVGVGRPLWDEGTGPLWLLADNGLAPAEEIVSAARSLLEQTR